MWIKEFTVENAPKTPDMANWTVAVDFNDLDGVVDVLDEVHRGDVSPRMFYDGVVMEAAPGAVTESAGHDIDPSVMTWLEGLKNGHDREVMARGKHFYFNCDGVNHYVYEVDESRREVKNNGKLGRKKRAYVGTIAKARHECQNEASQWESKHSCHDRSESHDSGGDFEPAGEIAGHPVFVVRE